MSTKKTPLWLLGLVVLLALGSPAVAEICTIDDVPAATLLLPYFEVALTDTNGDGVIDGDGITTLFSINNASASAAVAHVTLWTDESIPTLDFDVYLTGYDVQTINMRDIFNGILPRTADAGADTGDTGNPADGISNKGILSQDINFPGSSGPCGATSTLYPAAPTPALSSTLIEHVRTSHTGFASPVYGGCVGLNYGEPAGSRIARGYVTVDTVTTCNLQFPSSTGYFSGIADFRNLLWGDYFYVTPGENFAQGETLVHIEACVPGNGYSGYVGNGAGRCPFGPGDYTFYGRYVAGTGIDNRESLSTNFATRFANGGGFDGGTDLFVWRDSKIPLGAVVPVHACSGANAKFSWVPLNQADVVAFDEFENPQDLCFQGDNFSPPIGGAETCFPVEAQRVNLTASDVPFGSTPAPSASFGWMFLNLNTTVTGQAPGLPVPTAQAWVTTGMSAEGRYAVGFDAIQLDTACDNITGGVLLLP